MTTKGSQTGYRTKDREEETGYQVEGRGEQTNWKNEKPDWDPALKENFSKELGKLNGGERFKDAFDNNKDLLEFDKKEGLEHLEARAEAFRNMEFSTPSERFEASSEIARHEFRETYEELEHLEAKNSEAVSDQMKQAFKNAGVTDYQYEQRTDRINFTVENDQQLQDLEKELGRPIYGTRRNPDESWTCNVEPDTDETVVDAQRRLEVEQATYDYQIHLQSRSYNQDAASAAERMNDALERADEAVHGPSENLGDVRKLSYEDWLEDHPSPEIENMSDGQKYMYEEWCKANLGEEVEDLETYRKSRYEEYSNEKTGEYIADRQAETWSNVRNEIAENHPDEAESLRVAAESIQAAHAERLDLLTWHNRNEQEIEEALTKMDQSANEFILAVQEGRSVAFTDANDPDLDLQFTENRPSSIWEIEAIQIEATAKIDIAKDYKYVSYTDPALDPDQSLHTLQILERDLYREVQEIHALQAAGQDNEALDAMIETAGHRARAMQHLMRAPDEYEIPTRQEAEQEEDLVAA